MKKIIFILLLCGSAFTQTIQVQCPANGAPVTALTTRNTTNDQIVQNGCIDALGNITFNRARADLFAQQANIALTPLFTVPLNSGGMYLITFVAGTTQAATTSSTIPNLQLQYTDGDTVSGVSNPGIANSSGTSPTSNSVGAETSSVTVVNLKAGSVFSWGTVNYASSGATPMQFAAHIKVQFLGN